MDQPSAKRLPEKNRHKKYRIDFPGIGELVNHAFPGNIGLERPAVAGASVSVTTPLLTAALIVIYCLTRLWNLFDYSLWGSEIFAIYGVRQDWAGMIAYYVDDIVHPPFFYFLLRFWMDIGGESMEWLKLLPALISLASIIPFLLLGRELRLRPQEINLALFFMAVNGFLIHYSQEMRSYILLFFFSLFSYWLFVRFFKYGRNVDLIALFVINLLLVYTHYYGWLVVGMEFFFLLLWARQKIFPFIVSIIGIGLLFLPWAYLVLLSALQKQGLAQNLDWITRPGLLRVAGFFFSLNGQLAFLFPLNIVLSLALFGAPIILWIWHIVFKKQSTDPESTALFWWLFLLTFIPLALIFLASIIYPQAMWIDRYFIFVAGPYLLLAAIAALRIQPTWVRNTIVGTMIVWSTLAGYSDWITNRIAWESPQLGSRIAWEDVATKISQAEQAQAGPVRLYSVPVVSNGIPTGFWAVDRSVKYYFELLNDDRFQIEYAHNLEAVMNNAQESHYWVALFDLGQFQKRSPQEVFTNKGYSVGESIEVKNTNKRLLIFPVWHD